MSYLIESSTPNYKTCKNVLGSCVNTSTIMKNVLQNMQTTCAIEDMWFDVWKIESFLRNIVRRTVQSTGLGFPSRVDEKVC